MKTLSRMMLAAAASSMAVLPVAAEAGTRTSSQNATYAVSAPGKGRDAKGEKAGSSFLVWGIIGFTAAGVAIYGVVNTNRGPFTNCVSPGAGGCVRPR